MLPLCMHIIMNHHLLLTMSPVVAFFISLININLVYTLHTVTICQTASMMHYHSLSTLALYYHKLLCTSPDGLGSIQTSVSGDSKKQ